MTALPAHVRVAVVGSGFSGLAMAVRLRQRGLEDFVVLERADDVGGTWRDNTYPGCACDVPSHLYSLSFAPNPGWSHTFSRQPEIHAYLRRTAQEHGVLPHVRTGTDLLAADWDDAAQCWRLRTSRGDLSATVLVSACGGLVEPAYPEVPGVEGFAGPAFHSARWDHDVDLAGKRVAVVGTGASAVQFVPHLQQVAGHVTVFQRTPPWVLPRVDRELGPGLKRAFAAVPALQRAARAGQYAVRELNLFAFTGKGRMRALAEKAALEHLERQVPDPALRALLTPDYRFGCKRVLLSNEYLPALTQPNVTVVPHGVREVRPDALVAADGSVHEADVIVYGTGFRVMDLPVAHRVTGRTGETLADHWGGRPEAHLGATVAGFPNLFLLLGPNTALGHTSVVVMAEAQVAYVLAALDELERTGATSLDVRPAAQRAYNDRLQRGLSTTVWAQGGCKAWYTGPDGHNFTLWPGHTFTFRRQTARFDAHSYELVHGSGLRAAPPALETV